LDIVGLRSLYDSRPIVGLNVSGLLLMGGYSRRNMFGLRSDYRELIRDLIHFLISEKQLSVLLVPHVFSREPESDVIACEEFFGSLGDKYKGRLGILRGQYNQNEIKFVIGQCNFLIGARMHACIAAVSQSVPAICMAYSDKFIGVMETIGIEDIVVDARKLDKSDMLRAIGRTIDKRAEVCRLLQSRMPGVKSSVMNLLVSAKGNDGQNLVKDEVGILWT
jgi:polysaccharide pyruvyl transferase WcaK-like protein